MHKSVVLSLHYFRGKGGWMGWKDGRMDGGNSDNTEYTVWRQHEKRRPDHRVDPVTAFSGGSMLRSLLETELNHPVQQEKSLNCCLMAGELLMAHFPQDVTLFF